MKKFIYIIGIIVLTFLMPFICFYLGWISGWLIKITIGQKIVSGLALVGLNLSLDKLPLFFGTVAIITSFFKNPNNFKEK